MNYNIASYLVYLPLTIYITVWVGWVFYKNGEVFLSQMLRNDQQLVAPVNKLLLIGYYLLNIGYATLMVASWTEIKTPLQAVEELSQRTAFILLILAFMHYMNITVITLWHHFEYKNNKQMFNRPQENCGKI